MIRRTRNWLFRSLLKIRPNARFEELCQLAGIKAKLDIESGTEEPWELKEPQEDLCDLL